MVPDALARAAGAGLLVDCRSSSYLVMGAPRALADRTVLVRVARDGAGPRGVGSQLARRTRGELARHLLETGANPRTPGALAEVLTARWPTSLLPPARGGQPWTVEVLAA